MHSIIRMNWVLCPDIDQNNNFILPTATRIVNPQTVKSTAEENMLERALNLLAFTGQWAIETIGS